MGMEQTLLPRSWVGPNRAAVWVFAVAALLTGILLGVGLLDLAAAHADLQRACLEGGGTEYQAPEDMTHDGGSAEPTSDGVGTCYHPE